MSDSEHHLVAVKLGVSTPGVALSVLLLFLIAYLLWNPVSRPCLDRVSFRLLSYALVANVIVGATTLPNMKETTPGCSVVAFFLTTSPLFAAAMFCSMALNLQLVLLYSVNGNKMEKYYVVGALILCGACSFPTAAAGELGWYATNGVCWLRDPVPAVQLHWFIAMQAIPMLSMSAVELVSVVRITIFMIKHARAMQRLRNEATLQSADIPDSGVATLAATLPEHPIVRYRSTIIRIALYPLLSCFVGTTACILDVYSIRDPQLHSFAVSYAPLTGVSADVFIWCLRPLLYALLAATDPSLVRAIRALNLEPCSQCTRRRGGEDLTYELATVQFAAKVTQLSMPPGSDAQTQSQTQPRSSSAAVAEAGGVSAQEEPCADGTGIGQQL
ncbi:hypothetical protein DFH06DRAFT_1391233 [Mycena polygramma]|nr:hypothetical protein DFH06DRAFT_1391233 [Mycena polygramma]